MFTLFVVVATTKVQIFKQITTHPHIIVGRQLLLLLPQRYKFSSKSQLVGNPFRRLLGCCCYHKGTNFQANHNWCTIPHQPPCVVVATTKVQIFKQITTKKQPAICQIQLLLLPQRYKFSSKSQHHLTDGVLLLVVVATTKVQIFKQITTPGLLDPLRDGLLLAQKYTNNSINPNLRIHILSKRMVAVPMY